MAFSWRENSICSIVENIEINYSNDIPVFHTIHDVNKRRGFHHLSSKTVHLLLYIFLRGKSFAFYVEIS